MSASASIKRPNRVATGTQPATFSYFRFNPDVHTHEKPYEVVINLPCAQDPTSNYKRHNQEFENHQTVVEDVRGIQDHFSLDIHGVCWRQWEGPEAWKGISAYGVQGLGRERIMAEYMPSVENFIKNELESQDGHKVDIVKVFDYRLRVSMDMKDFGNRTLDLDDGLDPMVPVVHPHVDQSFDGSVTRVRVHMGEQADDLLKRRFRIVNLWRPLHKVTNWPLATCDSNTVRQDDLVAADLVRRRYVGETFYSKYNPEHRWYYLSHQEPNEITMLKIYDSDSNMPSRFCLHSSFQLQGYGPQDRRESFEVRALVFDADE